MTDFKRYVTIFHKLTLKIDSGFEHIPSYFERLAKYNSMSIELSELKKAFKIDFAKSEKFREEYRKYMNDNFDFVLFTNALVSTPDMRKFDAENKYMPFVVYIYQILIWEFSRYFGITLSKSRDIGASYTFNIGAAMSLCLSDTLSALFMSKTENDVDITGDRLQTNMGRVRQVIESTIIYDLKKFQVDKYLNIFSNEKCGIKGSSTTATAGTGGRFQYAMIDESGVIKNLTQILRSITYSVTRTHIFGTFKSGSDAGLRAAIKDAHKIDIDKYIEMYKELIVENDFNYRKTIDFIIADLKKEVPEGKNITFKITYKHHPLKKGNCDYHAIESNRLLNDPIAIALELEADETVGSPDRSFYNMQNDNFITDKDFEKIKVISDDFELVAGFDPGGASSVALIPALHSKSTGQLFVLPTEEFHADSITWLSKVQMKYKKFGKMKVFAESSVMAYKSLGEGWTKTFKQFEFFELNIISNKHPETQLLIANHAFQFKSYNPIFRREMKNILIHENEKSDFMIYIYGGKYSNDKEQKRVSHKSEALLTMLFALYDYVLYNHNYQVR